MLNNLLKILLFILLWIGCATLYCIIICIGNHLLITEVVNFKYKFLDYIYYLGLGIISYYPCNYMIKKSK
jgi:hypothetical protein